MSITKRLTKGTPLSFTEMDANWDVLNGITDGTQSGDVTANNANIVLANLTGALTGLTATTGWTNTNANFAELTNTVANIIQILKGLK